MTDDTAATALSILLLHGVGSSAATWWRASEDLTELGWQVTAPDLLGHGGRPAGGLTSDWLSALAADVIATTAGHRFDVVLGHSLGALVALTLATTRPSTAGAVLIEDPPALGGHLTVEAVAADLEDTARRGQTDAEAEQRRLTAANPYWSPRDVAGVVENRRRLDVGPVVAQLRQSSWDLPAMVADCPLPLGLIAAEGPDTATVEPGRSALLALLPGDRVALIRGGHGVHRDRPALWLRSVVTLSEILLAAV